MHCLLLFVMSAALLSIHLDMHQDDLSRQSVWLGAWTPYLVLGRDLCFVPCVYLFLFLHTSITVEGNRKYHVKYISTFFCILYFQAMLLNRDEVMNISLALIG